ncbi:MAG: DUF1592 domain-containing protein [Lentisphaerales bacterium]|nr:DUF1592 domain-containing protein [Lentisphaerales bacterium]
MKFKLLKLSLLLWLAQPLVADLTIPSSIEPFFEKYCYNCHDADTEKGDLNLEALTRKISNATDAAHWQDILDQMNAGEMPPKKKKQPSKEELSGAIGDLTKVLFEAEDKLRDSGGEIALRRLNRREYQATIKDLMGIKFNMKKLPADTSARFDTIGQNQSLSSMQLRKYFSFNREIVSTSLFWAVKPRNNTSVTKVSGANKMKKEKRIYEVIKLVKRINKTGENYRDLGISDAEWALHNPGTATYKKRDTYAQYYIKNVDFHSKGRMLPMHNLVSSLGVHFSRDARATYRLRVNAGVVDGVKIRRGVRLTIPENGLGAKNGKPIGSFFITGSIEKTSTHEMLFEAENDISFKPTSAKKARQSVSIYEDVKGKPGMQQMYHHYSPIEPNAPMETIMVKWASAEGPIYAPKTPFELLVEKYKVASADDEKLDQIVREFLEQFAVEAFRGNEASKDFIDGLVEYYHNERKKGKDFKEAIIDPLAMILSSTKFLYLLEQSENKLDAVSLANRLSYFLWSSAPDAKLMKLAESGEILKPEVLQSEVDRLLVSSKAESFYSGFMSQWLHLKRFDGVGLNSKLLLHRTDAMIDASRREPVEFFKTLVSEDLCASNIIDSDFVMANGILAMKYGLGEHHKGDGFKKIKLPEGSPRGGVMTQAAFLSMGTMGNRTSPVIRGALVKEILLNDPPPPPPPNVPELVHTGVDPLASVRSLVVLHQQKAQCASCHARFDFIGLGLENFGPVGVWRDKEIVSQATEAQQLKRAKKKVYKVDASGELPDGTKFKDIFELKKALMKQKRQVAGSLLEGLLCYALGRDISFTDRPLIRQVLDDLEKKQSKGKVYTVKEMVKQVVTSQAFLEN